MGNLGASENTDMNFEIETTPSTRASYASFSLELASEDDVFQIVRLYFDEYLGLYPDPLMKDLNLMSEFIRSKEGFWFVSKNLKSQVIASVLIRYDEENLIAKAFGAVVRSECRGQHVMENLLSFAIDYLKKHTSGVDVIYSTTRTVNEAAQTLTEKLGFKKLGIFPNAHKTNDYETHCLAAIISDEALSKRHGEYRMHHEVHSLYEIVKGEVGLNDLESIIPEKPSRELIGLKDLEVVSSPKFVLYRYNVLKKENKLEFEFFPFHEPNILILSPDQSTELFCYLSPLDGYCAIIGGKMAKDLDFSELFIKANKLLRDHGARYIEIIARADKPKILDSMLKAKFIPCGIFPAFELINGKRYDFVILSRSFEIFDFQNVRLKGINQVYLEEYFKTWKKMSLNPKLLKI